LSDASRSSFAVGTTRSMPKRRVSWNQSDVPSAKPSFK
jgi:hypothetical protein